MTDAGFALLERRDSTQPGKWVTSRRVGGENLTVPVDLIVPEAFASGSPKHRSVRLGTHDKMAVRRTHGLEAALVDNSVMRLDSLEPGDNRSVDVRVAGPSALLIAKLHKLNDRLAPGQSPDRLGDKDAADIYRLMQVFPAEGISARLKELSTHAQAGLATKEAIVFLDELFGARGRRESQWPCRLSAPPFPKLESGRWRPHVRERFSPCTRNTGPRY